MTELARMSVAASNAWPSGSCGVVLLGGCLQDRFQIDRHRMIAGGDHVLLVHVARREAVKQRKPGAGAPEEALAAGLVGAPACSMNSVQP